ncbi:MAG: hypothetical protein IJ849_08360 [Selenomonadaceae bacterium]|nr:hypothetical protein [Selenomonadaceae bacterium]
MKNFFTEVDDVTMTYGDVAHTPDGMDYIRIYFEKPIEGGFAFLESSLPTLDIVETEGFSTKEEQELLDYAKTNAFIIWQLALGEEAKVA